MVTDNNYTALIALIRTDGITGLFIKKELLICEELFFEFKHSFLRETNIDLDEFRHSFINQWGCLQETICFKINKRDIKEASDLLMEEEFRRDERLGSLLNEFKFIQHRPHPNH